MSRSCEHSETECKTCWKDRMFSVGIAGSATPSRRPVSGGRRPRDKSINNSWERGIAKDDRGMPYLDKRGVEVGVKQFSETRREYRQFQTPTITTPQE